MFQPLRQQNMYIFAPSIISYTPRSIHTCTCASLTDSVLHKVINSFIFYLVSVHSTRSSRDTFPVALLRTPRHSVVVFLPFPALIIITIFDIADDRPSEIYQEQQGKAAATKRTEPSRYFPSIFYSLLPSANAKMIVFFLLPFLWADAIIMPFSIRAQQITDCLVRPK